MTDPTRRSLALAAARTSDAGANLRARVAELGHTIWAARTAGVSIPDTTREIVHGRARAAATAHKIGSSPQSGSLITAQK